MLAGKLFTYEASSITHDSLKTENIEWSGQRLDWTREVAFDECRQHMNDETSPVLRSVSHRFDNARKRSYRMHPRSFDAKQLSPLNCETIDIRLDGLLNEAGS